MTTSNSIDFSMSRNEIITDAFLLAGVYGVEETINNPDIVVANRALNRLIKHWENQAIHIWKRSEATVFLQASQASYVLGSGGSDHATESFTQTTISADEASGQTIISLTSVSGITANDYIGIVQDDDTIHWTTVSLVGADTVTITDALTDTATSGNVVYAYTTKINKPLSVFDIRRRTVSDSTDISIPPIQYEEYQRMPNKTTNTGTVVQWTYDRKISNGTLYVWPAPANVDYILKITYAKPLEDFDSASNTPDVPQEWYEALVTNLAVKLARMYKSASPAELSELKLDAAQILGEALSFDQEFTYIKMVPDSRMGV